MTSKLATAFLTLTLTIPALHFEAHAQDWNRDLRTLTSLGMSLEAASAQLACSHPGHAPGIAVTASRMAPSSAPRIAAAVAAAVPSKSSAIASAVAAATPKQSVSIAKAVTDVVVGLENRKTFTGLSQSGAGFSPSG